jgi:hypothetical protein
MQDQAAALQELVAVFQLDASRKVALPKPALAPRLALAPKKPALRRAA